MRQLRRVNFAHRITASRPLRRAGFWQPSFFRAIRDFTNHAAKEVTLTLSRGPPTFRLRIWGSEVRIFPGAPAKLRWRCHFQEPAINHPRLKLPFSLGFSLGNFLDRQRIFSGASPSGRALGALRPEPLGRSRELSSRA